MKIKKWIQIGVIGLGIFHAARGYSQEKNHSAPAAAATGEHWGRKVSTAKSVGKSVADNPAAYWLDLLEGNKRFAEGKSRARDLVGARKKLAGGQSPHVMILACADSRVGPELVFDKNLGDLFVVRTAGNVADPVALGSLEYAAEHLHSRLLVVLGHRKCGAVAAAASGEKMPSVNLDAIVKRIAPALASLKSKFNGDDLVKNGVDANAKLSAENLTKESHILEELVGEGKIFILPAVYDLETGRVSRL